MKSQTEKIKSSETWWWQHSAVVLCLFNWTKNLLLSVIKTEIKGEKNLLKGFPPIWCADMEYRWTWQNGQNPENESTRDLTKHEMKAFVELGRCTYFYSSDITLDIFVYYWSWIVMLKIYITTMDFVSDGISNL